MYSAWYSALGFGSLGLRSSRHPSFRCRVVWGSCYALCLPALAIDCLSLLSLQMFTGLAYDSSAYWTLGSEVARSFAGAGESGMAAMPSASLPLLLTALVCCPCTPPQCPAHNSFACLAQQQQAPPGWRYGNSMWSVCANQCWSGHTYVETRRAAGQHVHRHSQHHCLQ